MLVLKVNWGNAMKRAGLLDFLAKGRAISHYVKMPNIVVVGNLEEAKRLRRRYSPKQYVIAHGPSLDIDEQEYKTFRMSWSDKVHGIFINSKDVRYGLSYLYEKNGMNGSDLKETLTSLEESISDAITRRSECMSQLEDAAEELIADKTGKYSNGDIIQLIQQITTSLFEFREHFIREGVQNADGSSREKANNRIDIYLNPEEQLIRIEDKGDGMTPEIGETKYFNFYASLYELLQHAAGKFGVGAGSMFGLKHEYVKVDSRHKDGQGWMALVNSDMNRDEHFFPSERKEHGTTVEIKLSKNSEVDFDRIIEILKEDCCYIKTPLYLHLGDSIEKLNKELIPPSSANTISFREKNIEGHLVNTPGKGKLKLLDHRIQLHTLETEGYSGVVDCSGFSTIFSRDIVTDDPVLKNVLEYIDVKARQLRQASSLQLKNMSLEAKLNDYKSFVGKKLFTDNGMPNEEWIKDNLEVLMKGREHKSALVGMRNNRPKLYLRTILGYGLLKAGLILGYPLYGLNKRFSDKVAKLKAELKSDPERRRDIANGIGNGVALSGCFSLLISDVRLAGLVGCGIFGETLARLGYNKLKDVVRGRHVNRMYAALFGGYNSSSFRRRAQYSIWAGYLATGLFIGHYTILPIVSRSLPEGEGIVSVGSKNAKELVITYSGRDSLVDQFVSRERWWGLGRKQKGYAPEGKYNNLFVKGRNIIWFNADSDHQNFLVEGPVIKFEDIDTSEFTLPDKLRNIKAYIDKNIEYDVIDAETGLKYDNILEAILGEKKAVCDGGNTLAAKMLYDMQERQLRGVSGTYDGIPHFWLEVNMGSAEEPSWGICDFTPTKMNPELQEALRKARAENRFDPSYLLLAALGVGGLMGIAKLRNHRYLTEPYQGEISADDREILFDAYQALKIYDNNISVHLGANLKENEPACVLTKNRVILNKEKRIDPGLIALGYTSKILKDESLAEKVADSFQFYQHSGGES